jgi:hypothetical protein
LATGGWRDGVGEFDEEDEEQPPRKSNELRETRKK